MERRLNRFDGIAPIYDFLADIVFFGAIKKAQEIHLDQIPPNARILVLGGGSGRWMRKLFQLNAGCTVYFVEASSRMLKKVEQNNSEHLEQIELVHGTHLDTPEIQFDAVITHFFLDMFSNDNVVDVIKLVKRRVKKEGLWLVADFVKKHWWHSLFLRMMYIFFRVVGSIDARKLPEWQTAIEGNGFFVDQSDYFFWRFISCKAYKVSS